MGESLSCTMVALGVHSVNWLDFYCPMSIKKQLKQISNLATCNPFSSRRFAMERKILGRQSESLDAIAWHRSNRNQSGKNEASRHNVVALTAMADQVVHSYRKKGRLEEDEIFDYWAVGTYLLLYRHITSLDESRLVPSTQSNQKEVAQSWVAFQRDYLEIFQLGNHFPCGVKDIAHLYACLVQVHRAFFNIFDHILGASQPIAVLREQVWESIFTSSMHDYHAFMFERMRDFSTLITGPSGTGKELVARAIGLSQYLPFDARKLQFKQAQDSLFLPLNLSALSATLIESELFGHRKGSFTGAVVDRIGWLESCSPNGCVFLDEIGELDLELQVKLLRVLQSRTYHRIGDSEELEFHGKIIAATNRNLEDEMEQGRFREDFYFRICSDRILTPSLKDQLECDQGDLGWMIESILYRLGVTDASERTQQLTDWITDNLGDNYPWPGNIRELEQCVRSFLIRKRYVPISSVQRPWTQAALPPWLKPAVDQSLTADELVCRYCTWVYANVGSYEQVSKIVKLDRRTVKSKINSDLLEQIRERQDHST